MVVPETSGEVIHTLDGGSMDRANQEGWNVIVAVFVMIMTFLSMIFMAVVLLSTGQRPKPAPRLKFGVKIKGRLYPEEFDTIEKAYKEVLHPNYNLGYIVAITEDGLCRELTKEENVEFHRVYTPNR